MDTEGYQVFAGCLFPNGDGARQLKKLSSSKLHIVGIDVTKDEDFRLAFAYVRDNLGENGELPQVLSRSHDFSV